MITILVEDLDQFRTVFRSSVQMTPNKDQMCSVLRYSCNQVQNSRYSYFTCTHIFSRPGTRTHTSTYGHMSLYFSQVSHK